MIEYDFYSNIFDEFVKANNDDNEKALWKMKTILKLMKLTEGNDEGDLCENGLRLIMLLHNNYVVYPFDSDDNCFSTESLTIPNEFISILKSEII